MIDIHCHPLAGVDDGAEDFAVSVGMCKLAAVDGVTHLVATPHCNYHFNFDFELNQQKIRELQAAIGEKPKLLLGCDFHISYDNIQRLTQTPKHFTINQASYLLIEMDDHFVPQQFDQVLYNLQVADVVPILTHPERNPVFRRKPELLANWVSRGCLAQLTAQSYGGGFGEEARRLCVLWLKHNLVHFFASDAHDETRRPPLLSSCYERLTEEYGEGVAQRLLVENPGAVVNGRPLAPGPEPIDFNKPKRKGWFSFLRS